MRMIQIISQGRLFCLPVKIPTWDTSHLEDERYEIAPGTCTWCRTMNWDLYRGLYFSWPSQNRQILPGAEPGSCGAGTVETASGPGAGSGGGDCVPTEPGMGGKPPPNWRSLLNKHLNVNAGRLLEENKGVTIRYLPVCHVS